MPTNHDARIDGDSNRAILPDYAAAQPDRDQELVAPGNPALDCDRVRAASHPDLGLSRVEADPAQAAYEARFADMTLGPRGAAPAWDDLPPEGKAVWQRVAETARQGQLTVAEHKKLVAATEAAFAALRTEHQEVLCDLSDRVDEIVRLREALKPFVEYARYALIAGMEGEIGEVIVGGFRRSISTQALRRAVEAYGEPEETSDAP